MNTIVWIHGDNLSPYNPALLAQKDAPTIFVWDETLLQEYQLSLKRIVFIYECLLELPITIRKGDVAQEIITFAQEHRANRILTTASPSPRFQQICATILREMPKGSTLEIYKERPFIEIDEQLDLKRFSRYWEKVKYKALHPK
jgi:hypothetical protein